MSARRHLRRADRLGVDPRVMRVVLSSHVSDGLLAVREYTTPDMLAAHLCIDLSEAVIQEEREKAKDKGRGGIYGRR